MKSKKAFLRIIFCSVLALLMVFNSVGFVFADTVYKVKEGDCLWKIAESYETTYQKLAEYNGIKNPDLIFVDQEIKIPDSTLQAQIDYTNMSYVASTDQNTPNGRVSGLVSSEGQTLKWLGVPYAKPPVGELRWRAPQNVDKWSGTLETKKFNNSSLQLSAGKVTGNEDCLYLNIYRPNTKSEKLAVMVFLHGGSNIGGSGNPFDPEPFVVKTNSIVVTINYRLGSLGWLNYSPLKTGNKLDDSGNFGLLDQIKALEWVRDNIESFGGNPGNVTLSGQSAGGRDVLGLLVSPLAKNLFHKAFSLSGAFTLADTSMGDTYGKDLVKRLAIKDGKAANDAEAQSWLDKQTPADIAAYLRTKSATDIAAVNPSVPIKMEPFPHLFKDGYVIPKEGKDVIKQGNYNKVPIILGSCANEFAMFALQDPSINAYSAELANLKDEKLQLLNDANNYGSKLYAGSNTDTVANLLVGVSGQPGVYGYRFSWGMNYDVLKSPINKHVAATHGMDLDFIFNRVNNIEKFFPKEYNSDANKPGRDDLSNVMMSYLKNFLYTGDPNGDGLVKWGTWQKDIDKERILILDADNNKAVVKMSKESWIKEDIIKQMNAELPKERLEKLINIQLKGRYFWDF